ncbi:MAG TPA: formate dehydrogenase accessory protein FdhE [Stellaceae bacterium]|nr:formate dehydrogenase accessory protein FdhE [Stellaceae bacterium]
MAAQTPNPRIVRDPSEIGGVAPAPFLVLPDPAALFSRRAGRIASLVPGNPFAGFLSFMAEIARAQAAAIARLSPARPPLDRGAILADSGWRDALLAIAESLDRAAVPEPAAAALRSLLGRGEEERARFAGRVLDRQFAAEEGAEAVFLVAALQVAFTQAAGGLAAAAATSSETPLCPLCRGLPVASLVHAAGERQGLRYLACALCAAEWRHTRIKCTACGNTKGLGYHAFAGADGPAKAEACPECNAYTKILYAEKDAAAEPMADDLASLALDVLMADSGWRRAYPNPFLVPGIA